MSEFFTHGYAIDDDDMHWHLNCPVCAFEMEFQGFFDSSDLYTCTACSCVFNVKKIFFSNDSYIQ